MSCFGLFKGVYDSNIWASLHDVVPPERRATAVGVINSIGWLGAGTATVTVAAASQRFGMSACISATSLIYLSLAFLLAWGIARFMSGRTCDGSLGNRMNSTKQGTTCRKPHNSVRLSFSTGMAR